jgi:hypothetical protein
MRPVLPAAARWSRRRVRRPRQRRRSWTYVSHGRTNGPAFVLLNQAQRAGDARCRATRTEISSRCRGADGKRGRLTRRARSAWYATGQPTFVAAREEPTAATCPHSDPRVHVGLGDHARSHRVIRRPVAREAPRESLPGRACPTRNRWRSGGGSGRAETGGH